MASIIRIKRSQVSGNPSTLAAGELAYSALTDNGSNGGDRLYIGIGTETGGNAANHLVIGGKFFTDRLDHTAGTLTASSALVVDADSKIDVLNVDNLTLNGNAITSTNTNGNIELTPNGTGSIVLDGQSWPQADGTADFYLKTNGSGQLSWSAIPSGTFTLAGNTGTDTFTTGETLTITGTGPVTSAVTDNTFTLSVADASTSAKGIASFDSTDFTVTSGAVTLNAERIQDVVGAMVSGTGATQNGISVGYDDTNGKLTFDVADPTITIDGDVDGSATMTNLGSTTITVTLDTVNTNTGSFGSSSQVPVITVNGKGLVTAVTTASISTSFTLAGDTGTPDTFNNGETLTIAGGEGIDTTVTNNTITISGEDASTSNKGIASFNSASFAVTAGDVTIKASGVSNSQLVNSSLTVGSTSISLGSTSTSLAGLTELAVDNLNFNGNTITSTDTNGNIILSPNGTGKVDVSGSIITGLNEPVNATDAATKSYVDTVAEGLHVHEAAHCATTDTLAVLSGGTVTYANGTLGVGATLTLSSGLTAIDGHTLTNGDRILVKNEVNQARNGMYVRTSATVLTRSSDFDTAAEMAGGDFTFVENGTQYAATGWVQTKEVLTVGSDIVVWQQFSGTGTFTAGDGLTANGTEFNVVGTAGRITVNPNSIDIASTYVGQTSITTLGTIATGTWNATAIGATKGGTGLTSYTTGDLLYASTTDTLAKLAAGADGKVLQMNSSGVPVWGDIDGGTY